MMRRVHLFSRLRVLPKFPIQVGQWNFFVGFLELCPHAHELSSVRIAQMQQDRQSLWAKRGSAIAPRCTLDDLRQDCLAIQRVIVSTLCICAFTDLQFLSLNAHVSRT